MAHSAARGRSPGGALRLRLAVGGWLLGVAVGSVALAACASDAEDQSRPGARTPSEHQSTLSSSEQASGPSGGQSSPEPTDGAQESAAVRAELADVECFGKSITSAGTPGSDELTGTGHRDVIFTRGGADLVTGLDRNDRVCTGAGNDQVEIESRNSYARVDLGGGDDRFSGLADVVRGGPGADEIHVEDALSVEPGPGRDQVVTEPVRDPNNAVCLDYSGLTHRIVADLRRGWVRGEGVDRVRGVQCVYGTRVADVITGSPRNDLLYACGFGADYAADRAHNVIRAGGGNDGVTLCGGGDLAYLGDGRDTAMGGDGFDWVYGGADRDNIWGIGGSDHLFGGDGNDRVNGTFFCDTGSSAGTGMGDISPNWVWGGAGDDEVTGDLAADMLNGGPGFDHGYGGPAGREGADVIVSVERRTSCP